MLTHETLAWEDLRQCGAAYSPTARYLMALVIVTMLMPDRTVVRTQLLSSELGWFVTDPKAAIFLGLSAGLAETRPTVALTITFAA